MIPLPPTVILRLDSPSSEGVKSKADARQVSPSHSRSRLSFIRRMCVVAVLPSLAPSYRWTRYGRL